ncbi:MAG: type I-U CRISPR-associated helicase/endonuclease Cas3 [Enhygromyxa sp.]
MNDLSQADFDGFMREVTGFDPFPWQRRLLKTVLECGWPRLLDLPTGTGKTSTLLIALYALALVPERSPRRIALIVDRRIIVDQVDAFARKIDEALGDPGKSVCSRVAKRLMALSASADAKPLRVVQLRGGIPRDDSWVGTPDQPTIIASTVDQIGSRLLFRGYGVSEGMRPIHAGILARDSLFFLDEVHLATAFEETLGRLHDTYANWPECDGAGRKLEVVRMSATPRDSEESAEVFGLDEDDRADPELARRLGAARPAKLELVKTKRAATPEARADNRALVAAAACKKALVAAEAGAKKIGVVVNRVDTARLSAATLRKTHNDNVLLLTGRMRPYDKAAIQEKLERTVASGVEREEDASPTFVVATSCIEAGADLDFDALVTEVASLDALRQRFGRLNRLGRHPHARAWVLGRTDQLGSSAAEDFVYGYALRETWAYLNETATDQQVDFGLSAFVEPAGEQRKPLLPPIKEAPVLFPSYLDMWSETRPAPHPDPDITLWLHGKDANPERDVNVVFRADIPAANPNDTGLFDAVAETVEFLPPVADEAVSVARKQFERWVGQEAHVWRWTADGVEIVSADELEVGDTVLVPASAGGLGAGTWDPESTEAVEDVAERASFATKGIAKLRIDPRTLPEPLRAKVPRPIESDDPEELESARQECLDWLNNLRSSLDELPLDWRELLKAIVAPEAKYDLSFGTSPWGDKTWRLTVLPKRRAVEATTEDTVSVFSGIEVLLDAHLEDVEAWASAFASAAGISAEVASDVALAGRLHDIGKADMRFQALLYGGDPIRAIGGRLIAKSRQFGSAKGREQAQRRSGWPSGLRHELISLALLDASPELQERADDLDLVRHLVASHHGWCRPWAPTTVDPNPMTVRVTVAGVEVEVSTAALDDDFFNECASRFRRLCRRYGWHGLAYLEALLRLGDHRASHRPGVRP